MNKVIKYVVYDIIRNKIVIAYTLFLLLISFAFFGLDTDPNKGLLSLLNIVLIVVPLVSIIFSTIHFYNSYEFIELLLAQPISRCKIFMSEYIGVASSLTYSFLVGVGIPAMVFNGTDKAAYLVLAGMLLTLVFVSIAFLASILTRDKAKGIGASLLLWFYFSLIYDGLVLLLLFSFSDYPLEKPILLLTSLNPIDLGRLIVLLKMDTSALMGYTGALFKEFFGSQLGVALSLVVMSLWAVLPLWVAQRVFGRKDL
ncbi:MAG: ABC transporter permease subunit [Spirosomataceae bacterium]